MIKCTFWNNDLDKIAIGQCYRIKDLTVRLFDGEKVLTTSPNSTITKVEDVGPILEEQLPNTTKEMEFEIQTIKCTAYNNCAICSRGMGNFNPIFKTIKCPNCGMVPKADKIITMFRAELVIRCNQKTKRLQMLDAAIKSQPALAVMNTTQEIEEYFMLHCNIVKAEVSGNETAIIKLFSVQ